MNTRREFLQGSAGGALTALGVLGAPLPASAASGSDRAPTSARCSPSSRARPSRGTSRSPSCRRSSPTWRPGSGRARGKLLELLHYAPPPCDPRAEVVERVDRGDHVREKVLFNTTPDLRVPAYVLVPKKADRPAPARRRPARPRRVLPLGQGEAGRDRRRAPGPDRLQEAALRGHAASPRRWRAQGTWWSSIDMFYWGERRMLLDDDPADWRERPASLTPERVAAFNRRVASRAARRPDASTRPGSPGRA